MKIISLLVLCAVSAVSTVSTFGADSCLTGKCLSAPVKAVGSVVNGTVGAVGNTVGAVKNVASNAVEAVVEARPVQRVATVTRSTARVAVNTVKRPFRLFRR